MSYNEALSRMQQYEAELAQQEEGIRNNPISNRLNNDTKTKLGVNLGLGALRASAASAATTAGAASPALGLSIAGLLPFLNMSQSSMNNKREATFKTERALLETSPQNITRGDIIKTTGLGMKKASQTSMNTAMALMAAGSLGVPGATQAGMAMYGLGGLTGGPLRAAMTYSGFKAAGGLGAALSGSSAVNPIMAGVASAPSIIGNTVGGAVSGVGGLANMLGFGKVGSAIGAGGSAISSGGSAMTAIGMANPIVGMIAGVAAMALATPIMTKAFDKIQSKAMGNALLKSGINQRPRIQQAHLIAQQYSTTRALDQQVNMLGQSGQLKMGEWLQLSYLGSIEKNTSMLRFMAEHIQELDSQKQFSSDMTQNNIQSKFKQSGIQGLDLSGGFLENDDIEGMDPGMAKFMAKLNRGAMKAAVGFTESIEKYGSFFDITAYLKGGKDNPFAKYKRMQEQQEFDSTAKEFSKQTGLSLSMVNALETSATELANMGDSSADKTVALLAGIYEVEKISAYKLMDISNALGVSEQDSFMGKFRELMGAAAENQDTRKKGFFSGMAEGASNIPFLPLILGGAAALATGGIGAAAMGATALGAGSSIFALAGDKRSRSKGELLNFDDSLEQVANDGIMPQVGRGLSVDARQLQLAADQDSAEWMQKQEAAMDMSIDYYDDATDSTKGIWVNMVNDPNHPGNNTGGALGNLLMGAAVLGGAAYTFLESNIGKASTGDALIAGATVGGGLLMTTKNPFIALAGGLMAGVYAKWGDNLTNFVSNEIEETTWKGALVAGATTAGGLLYATKNPMIAVAGGLMSGLYTRYHEQINGEISETFTEGTWENALMKGAVTGGTILYMTKNPMAALVGGLMSVVWSKYGDKIKGFFDSDKAVDNIADASRSPIMPTSVQAMGTALGIMTDFFSGERDTTDRPWLTDRLKSVPGTPRNHTASVVQDSKEIEKLKRLDYERIQATVNQGANSPIDDDSNFYLKNFTNDQREIGQGIIGQQSNIIEGLSGLMQLTQTGTKDLVQAIQTLTNVQQEGNALGANVVPGNM